jgi:hypothetical protein
VRGAVLGLAVAACRPEASSTASPAAAGGAPAGACPSCECKCDCQTQSGEIADLIASASRKIAHRDRTCMTDLNRIRALDSRTDARLGWQRATCEMVAGHCEAGKARVMKTMQEDQALAPEVAETTAQSLVSLYCQGALPPREDLLRSMMALQTAYTARKPTEFCGEHFRVIQRHYPSVKPRSEDDHDVRNLGASLLIVAPKCFERAGDCQRAFATYGTVVGMLERTDHYHYGTDRWRKLPAAEKQRQLRTSFEAIFERCK